MIEPCMRGVGAKAAAQSTAIAMDAIAKPEILDFSQDGMRRRERVSAH